MADENTRTADAAADGHGPMCPPESAGEPEAPEASEAPEAPALPASEGAPGISGAEGVGVTVADIGLVEGAKDAVRTLARRLAGVADSEVTVPASVEVLLQAMTPSGAQWVMSCDLTKATLYFVTYEAPQMAYFVDAYIHAPIPEGRLTVPTEHSYA